MSVYQNNLKITYYDLDMDGGIKLSALLRMIQNAADQDANNLGIGFTALTPLNMGFVLQRFGISITQMPAYNDTVTIRTWPDSIARGTFFRKGDMYSACGKKQMEWASQWILFDTAERKILKPKALPIEIQGAPDMGIEIMPKKIPLPQSGEVFSSYTHTVRYSDADTNRHMNNSIYGDLISNALHPAPSAITNSQSPSQQHPGQQRPQWNEIQINYLAETKPGEVIKVTATKTENGYLVTGEANDKISFTAMTLFGK